MRVILVCIYSLVSPPPPPACFVDCVKGTKYNISGSFDDYISKLNKRLSVWQEVG